MATDSTNDGDRQAALSRWTDLDSERTVWRLTHSPEQGAQRIQLQDNRKHNTAKMILLALLEINQPWDLQLMFELKTNSENFDINIE